jgi:tetratricopeptide (TPR) repeat protein
VAAVVAYRDASNVAADRLPPPQPYIQRLSQDIDKAEREAKQKPKDSNVQHRLGMAYARALRYYEAAAAFQRAMRAGLDTAEIHHQLASCAMYLGYEDMSIAEFERAVEREPNNINRYAALMEAYDELGKTEQALQVVNRAAKRMMSLHDRPCCRVDPAKTPEEESRPATRAEIIGKLSSLYGMLGRWDKALPFTQNAVALDSQAPQGLALLGACYFHTGQYAKAIPPLRRAVQHPQAVPDVFLLLGMALIRASEEGKPPAEAMRTLEATIKRSPTMAQAWFELGKMCALNRQWDKAAKAYVNAYNYGFEPVNSMKLASEMFKKVGNREAAAYFEGLYWQNHRQFEKALKYFETGLKSRDPRMRLLAYAHVSNVLHQLRRDAEAIEILERAVNQERKQPSPMVADIYRLLAEAYLNVRNLGGRITALERAADLAPEHAVHSFRELGYFYHGDSQYDKAEHYFRECLRREPDNPEFAFLLAKTLFARSHEGDRLQSCIQLLQRAVASDPFYTDAYRLLALAYQRAEQWDRAADALQRVINYEPGGGEAYLELSRCYQRLKQPQKAQAMMEMYRQFRHWKTKLELLETRVKERPRDPEAQFALGCFYFEAKDYFKALLRFEKAVRLKPDHHGARRRLALIYEFLARPEDARREREAMARPTMNPDQ